MKWLSLATVRKYEPMARALGVSEVARSSRGFLTAYKRAKGDPAKLPTEWHAKRSAFIARHMAQVRSRKENLGTKDFPSRRHLALIMWAYSPQRL
jgi:hypothetical protein